MSRKIISHILTLSFILPTIFGVFSAEKVNAQYGGMSSSQAAYQLNQTQQIQNNRTRAQQDLSRAGDTYRELQSEYDNTPLNERTPEQEDRLNQARAAYETASQDYTIANDREQARIQAEKDEASRGSGCSLMPGYFSLSKCIAAAWSTISEIILTAFATILAITGMLLNLVLDFSMIKMSNFINDTTSITAAWSAIRDIANMFFIFILLYISISTILGLAHGETKKMLAHVIVAALLINFSLFFTKVIIDGSNLLAFSFYKAIPGAYTYETTGPGGNKQVGLSGSIVDRLKLQTIYKLSTEDGASDNIANPFTFIFATVGGAVFILITSIVFLVVALLFIIRFIIVVFLLILSPLAFMGMILPQLSHYSHEWWETLIGQVIFAPAVMILMWITFKTMETIPAFDAGNGTFFNVLTATAQASLSPLINFTVYIAMIIASLIIAKKVASAGYGEIFAPTVDKFQGFLARRLVRGVELEKDRQFMGFTIPKGEYGLRRLDEKFGESKWGATPFGHAIREYSTGALANAKFGGEMSAEESYLQDIHLETEHEEIEHREHFMQLVKDGAQPIEVRRALSKITPHGFTLLPKEVLMDEKYMRYATVAQMQAVKDEHEGRLSEQEKRKAAQARIAHHMRNLEEYDKMYDEWEARLKAYMEKAPDKETEPEEFKKYVEAAKHIEELQQPAFSKTHAETRKWFREMVPQEVDLMYWTNPEILTKKGVSAIKFGTLEAIRKSQIIGEEDKDIARGTKGIDFLVAQDAYMGIDLTVEDDIKDVLRDTFNKAYDNGNGEDLAVLEKEVEANISKIPKEKLEEIKRKYRGTDKIRLEVKDGEEKVYFKYKYNIGSRAFSEHLMDEAYGGKNPTEILRMRSKHWKTPAIYKILGVDQMRDMNRDKDNSEKEPYIDFAIEERAKELAGETDPATGKPYRMSDQTRSVLKWIRDDDRYAREYLPGYKLRSGRHAGKNFREIVFADVENLGGLDKPKK